EEALKLLDDSIADAIKQNEFSWVPTLSNHAARVSQFMGNQQLREHYYRQALEFFPTNPMALYGLAIIPQERGEPSTAKQYATKCYQAIVESNDEISKRGLLNLVVLHWQDVLQK